MAFGIIAIIIMLCTMDMDYTDIWRYLKQAGIYFPLILGLWLVIYWVNTCSWWLIINDEGRVKGLSFWRVYKLTVSGFALNYTTPCGLMGGEPTPLIVTIVLFSISCFLTQFMSNTASAALLCPIGIAIAKQLNADPKAVVMAIAVAASCAFATPVGTPPCTLVLGPGGYKFMDYVKCGTGLVLVCFVVSLVIIPMVWPFFP